MVLKGLVDFRTPEKHHIITSSTEHPAILNPALFLAELGVKVTILPVDGFGRVDPDQVRRAILPETVLITIMTANNETGTLQPVQRDFRNRRAAQHSFSYGCRPGGGKDAGGCIRSSAWIFSRSRGTNSTAPKGSEFSMLRDLGSSHPSHSWSGPGIR